MIDCIPFKGMRNDLNNRLPYYIDDFKLNNILNNKIFASILFMFFTNIGPAITFANLLETETHHNIGVIEVLFSTSITGIMGSLFFGQPLIIVGVTGPISILTISIYNICKLWEINFLTFYAWSQIWAGFILILQAILNNCNMIYFITRFSCEIFGVLIAIIYIYNGITSIINEFITKGTESGCFQMIISLFMLWLSNNLSNANKWYITNNKIRTIIADYGPSFSLILCSIIVNLPFTENINIDRLNIPSSSFNSTSGRPWVVPLFNTYVSEVFYAIIPGVIIAVLFFFDHNVSSLLTQAKEFKLQKPSTFHWDYFIVGINLILTGILGIPPTNGLIPQSPLHTKSLIVYKDSDESIENKEIEKVYEQRWSNLLTSILIGLICLNPFLKIIALIPSAGLSGLFLLMGMQSFSDNQFIDRIILICMESKKRTNSFANKNSWFIGYKSGDFDIDGNLVSNDISGPKDDNNKYNDLLKFTFSQLIITLIIFGIIFTPIAMIFPILIGILIPFRQIVLSKCINKESLFLYDNAIISKKYLFQESN